MEYGSNSNKIQIDGTIYDGTIDRVHQAVHEGKSFTANYEELLVANDGIARLRISTGSRPAHLVITSESEGKFRFRTYIGSTYSLQGTAADGIKLSVFNRFVGGVNPTATVRYNPTVTAIGTVRGIRTIFGGTGPQSTGGGGSDRIESIIPANSDFLIVLTNVSGQQKDLSLVLDWYEV